jgi:hypothetical protein
MHELKGKSLYTLTLCCLCELTQMGIYASELQICYNRVEAQILHQAARPHHRTLDKALAACQHMRAQKGRTAASNRK